MSFRTPLQLLALLAALGPLAAPAMAEKPRTVEALVEQLSSVDTFAAEFVQQRRDAEGNLRRESSGHFVLDRPGRFYWRYEKPYVQELIANDGVLWVYEPDLRQATRSPLEATQGAPIAILMGDRPVDEVFRIRALESDGDLAWFALRPREEAGDFREVLLGVDARGVEEMRFVDQLDQTTRVSFDAREYNQSVDESRFRFDPPEGVDVVEATQPPGVR
ncbi:outer membrane lipoprotein chaperone LolA [Guyparkeria hydrothermalis]|uniref:outer membrane lipoprotein chaperone LolA n=1 Tax=Guyparkeria hydrothermalis TaxID=923 RepID=UPI0024C3F6FA|nr:outer membrane lipoprotein chaperone LolA [Guyparkeria hydrothermalis]